MRRSDDARQPVLRRHTRDPNTGFINSWVSQPENVAEFTTAGLDVTMAYELATQNAGTFEFRLLGGYLHRLTSIATPGADVVSERNQQYTPKQIAKVDVTWMNGPWTLAYNADWFSKTLGTFFYTGAQASF